ncbi:MAG: hypothetical protein KGP28_08475 [Bdellovibrionales bacterium]|nr:hypothetical protein [Bdellovibrionales bacterium]
MKFLTFFGLLLPLSSLAVEIPVGNIGNSLKVFNALQEAGAEVKSNPIGAESVQLIRATNLICTMESAPDLDAKCTFFTKGEKGRTVKGVTSGENSWMLAFTLIAAGARKTELSDTVSEVRIDSMVCNSKSGKSESTCTFMQEQE